MPLTKEKYNNETKTFFEETSDKKELVEKLGRIEQLLTKYELEGKTEEETFKNLERALVIGKAGILRIERAINNKVYYITARKVKKAYLIGFADDTPTDSIIIQKNDEQTVLPYKEIYISRKEAKRERRGQQYYHLDKKHYDYFFPNEKYNKHTFLIEVKKGSNVFRVYTKILKTYWRSRTDRSYTLEDLKDTYFFDVEADFKKQKDKFLAKQRKNDKV